MSTVQSLQPDVACSVAQPLEDVLDPDRVKMPKAAPMSAESKGGGCAYAGRPIVLRRLTLAPPSSADGPVAGL